MLVQYVAILIVNTVTIGREDIVVDETIHHLLLTAFSYSNHAMTSRTRAYGLLPGQPKVLEFVAEHEGCLQRDIADACVMDRATVTGVLSRMETAGLVLRTPKANDRRALEVRLTDEGWAAAERVALFGSEVDEMACSDMTPEEREEFARLLSRAVASFRNAAGSGRK